MRNMLSLLSFLVLFCSLLYITSLTYEISQAEYNALKDLYDYTNGTNWNWGKLTSLSKKWNFTLSSGQTKNNPCCSATGGQCWKGISCMCDDSGSNNRICQITAIVLTSIGMNGTLPSSIGDLKYVNSLQIRSMPYLTGEIPSEICKMRNLTILLLTGNTHWGSMPSCLFNNVTSMQDMRLYDNQLTGSIPNFGTGMVNLFKVHLRNNRLTGEIPRTISNAINLAYFYIFNNDFNSSLPDSMQYLTKMNILNCRNASLVGNDYSWISKLTKLTLIDFRDNSIGGPLPDISNLNQIDQINLGANNFEGAVPESYGTRKTARYIVLYNNSLSGEFPRIQNGSKLTQLLLQHNSFTGSTDFLNITGPVALHNIDISNNYFSGHLNLDILNQYPLLNTFAASANCLHTTLSSNICNNKVMNTLVLDGISSANGCVARRDSTVYKDTTYTLTGSAFYGSLPSCLFSMSSMQTLHLSGNGYAGTLPEVNISSSLSSFVMSHNFLFGSIPEAFQTHTWSGLDLSYNKFTGTLRSDFNVFKNSSIVLELNRLSGDIPSALIAAYSVNILNGNMFTCETTGFGEYTLPPNDPISHQYSCGSYSIYLALIIFSVIGGITGSIAGLCYILNSNKWEKHSAVRIFHYCGMSSIHRSLRSYFESLKVIKRLDKKMNANTVPKLKLTNFSKTMNTFYESTRKNATIIVAVIVLFFSPLYAILSSYFPSYSNSYIWVVSMSYISGLAPGLVLFFIFMTMLSSFLYVRRDTFVFTHHDRKLGKFRFYDRLYHFSVLGILLLANIVVISIINVYYVQLESTTTGLYLTLVQIGMAVVKILWTNTFLKISLNSAAKMYVEKLVPGSGAMMENHGKLLTAMKKSNKRTINKRGSIVVAKSVRDVKKSTNNLGGISVDELDLIDDLISSFDESSSNGENKDADFVDVKTEILSRIELTIHISNQENIIDVNDLHDPAILGYNLFYDFPAIIDEDEVVFEENLIWIDKSTPDNSSVNQHSFSFPPSSSSMEPGFLFEKLKGHLPEHGISFYISKTKDRNDFHAHFELSLEDLGALSKGSVEDEQKAVITANLYNREVGDHKVDLLLKSLCAYPVVLSLTYRAHLVTKLDTAKIVAMHDSSQKITNWESLEVSRDTFSTLTFSEHRKKMLTNEHLGLDELLEADRQVMFMSEDHVRIYYAVKKMYTKFLVIIGAFNNIILPLVVFFFVSKSCFYNAIIQQPAVQSYYKYLFCCFCKAGYFTKCTDINDGYYTIYTAYDPPFSYSYQCSNAYYSAYCNVFIFKTVLSSFVIPMGKVIAHVVKDLLPKRQINTESMFYKVSSFLKKQTDFLVSLFTDEMTAAKSVISDNFIIAISNTFLAMFTFGVVFPPLAICQLMSVYVQTFYSQMEVGDEISRAIAEGDEDRYDDVIFAHSGFISTMAEVAMILIPVCFMFVSFFLFDMIGDKVGWKLALSIVIIMAILSFASTKGKFIHRQLSTLYRKLAFEDNAVEEIISHEASKLFPLVDKNPTRDEELYCPSGKAADDVTINDEGLYSTGNDVDSPAPSLETPKRVPSLLEDMGIELSPAPAQIDASKKTI